MKRMLFVLLMLGLALAYGSSTLNYENTDCPDETQWVDAALKCRESGMGHYYYYNEDGCKEVKCTYPATSNANVGVTDVTAVTITDADVDEAGDVDWWECPSGDERDERATACRNEGLSHGIYVDDYGCKQVKCIHKTENVSCTKYVESDCIVIKCEDGYHYNSCRAAEACSDIECETYEDNEGCVVKTCDDGSSVRECPAENLNASVECEVFTNDENCTVKECTNGYVYERCEESEEIGENESTEEEGTEDLETETANETAARELENRSIVKAFFEWLNGILGSK